MRQKLFLIIFILIFCFPMKAFGDDKQILSSWNDTDTKKEIIQFTEKVTDPESPYYVPPEDRIAVFDNDGTLCVEKPNYILLDYEYYSIGKKAEERPELREIEPYKSLYTGNMDYLFNMDFEEMICLLFNTHAGTQESVYKEEVKTFWETKLHPKFQQPYKDLAYVPMKELISYLQEKGFIVYIVSGSEVGFLRAISEEVYHIPVGNIIGSFGLYEFELLGDKTQIVKGKILSFNNGDKKPANIELYTGKKPILACGNSNGDLPMFQYTADNRNLSLCLLVHHDDSLREYGYDEDAEKSLKAAKEKNWVIMSMKNDFKKIFSFEK